MSKLLEEIKGSILWIALGLLVGFGLTFFVQSYSVNGISMEPTFEDNDRVFINKMDYWFNDIERQDIVVFKHEGNKLVKRVIAIGGDTIQINGNEVYVNGKKLNEPYITTPSNHPLYLEFNQIKEITVPEGHIFVLGDNRENSKDSRHIGFISEDIVIGKVSFRYFPFNKIGGNF